MKKMGRDLLSSVGAIIVPQGKKKKELPRGETNEGEWEKDANKGSLIGKGMEA